MTAKLGLKLENAVRKLRARTLCTHRFARIQCKVHDERRRNFNEMK